MKAFRWVEYQPLQCNTIQVAYRGENNIETCKWVRYDLEGPNPKVLGTQGIVWPVYEQELHANPRPAPNFSELCQFCDNTLQVFHYNHGSRALVDRALVQIGDIGLEAEVHRYRHLVEERDNLALHRQVLEREDLTNSDDILRSARFLANARGALRVGTTLFTYILPEYELARAKTRSPEPLPVPP